MVNIIGVRFRSAGKVYFFDVRDLTLRAGDHVIVETARGPEYGIVATRAREVADDMVAQPLRSVIRIATEEDEERRANLAAREKEALKICREKIHKHNLAMKLVDAECAFDENRIFFCFTADGRIDFRDLVKDLASTFHTRIELRQIGVRDETRMLGGIGSCGRELCCATYLNDFAPVSIKMAKEQNLSLNPGKISGICGRLMCCLKNEEETYEFLNQRMPKMGSAATTCDDRTGKVVELNVLRQSVRVLFEEGDQKSYETYPVEELTFTPRKRREEGQEKNGQEPFAQKREGTRPDQDRQGDRTRERAFRKKGRPDRGRGPADGPKPVGENHPERGNRQAGRERDRQGQEEGSSRQERRRPDRNRQDRRPERADGRPERRQERRPERADRRQDGKPERADSRPEKPVMAQADSDRPKKTSEMAIYAKRS